MRFGVFGVLMLVLFNSSLVMFEKTLFSAGFLSFFALEFLALSFLCWLLVLLVLLVLAFFFTSSCCCLIKQAPMFWLLLLLFWVCWVLLCVIFWVCFVLFSGFLGGFKGQVRWPKGPPDLALNTPYLFYFVFGLFFVGFGFFSVLLFLFVVFLKGLRAK